jgi:micrococcal nuclease
MALAAALSIALFATSAVPISAKTYEAKVKKVVDGDTIYVSYKGSLKKVRLLGIDAPESVSSKGELNTKLGKKAASYVRKKLLKKKVRLVFDKVKSDVYGRWLCHVYLGKVNFNSRRLAECISNRRHTPRA